jgi:2-amino-4-hydroxy-6-hydroxymethyldihydropteridine diphosphokinase
MMHISLRFLRPALILVKPPVFLVARRMADGYKRRMIFIGLGSNLGNREAYLAQARAALALHDVEMVTASALIETQALMPEGAPAEWNMPFLNQVVAVATRHSPHELLAILKLIETDLGRQARAHWAPREIDLDLLSYHDEIIVSDALTLPHPQLDVRDFVLRPLNEIAPQWRHPIFDKTPLEMLGELTL